MSRIGHYPAPLYQMGAVVAGTSLAVPEGCNSGRDWSSCMGERRISKDFDCPGGPRHKSVPTFKS